MDVYIQNQIYDSNHYQIMLSKSLKYLVNK